MPTQTNDRIAVVADIHANWPALDAVLKDINKKKVEGVWFLGDLLGYGAYPHKVVQVIQKKSQLSIAGNYDLNVLAFPKKKAKWKKSKHPSKYYSFKWSFKNITPEDKKYIKSLPKTKKINALGFEFLLVHGSPDGIDDPLATNTPRKKFVDIASRVNEDVVLCGHTHHFFTKTVSGVKFINPGSVGRPFDGDSRASYIILSKRGSKLLVENFRVKYDTARNLRKMKREGYPADICKSIELGLSLDDIPEEFKIT